MTLSGTESSASGTARMSSAVAYTLSAITTLRGSRVLSPNNWGMVTNSASDGIVNAMLARVNVIRRSHLTLRIAVPTGTAIRRPISKGSSARYRWVFE